jgi:hypothetical protein
LSRGLTREVEGCGSDGEAAEERIELGGMKITVPEWTLRTVSVHRGPADKR